MRKIIVLLLTACGVATSSLAQGLVGDWAGQMNGGFKVRIHIEKVSSGFTGKLINPSGSETILDEIKSDGTHLHFAVNKLNLSYDGVWNDQEKAWKGNLTFQQVYPLIPAPTWARLKVPVLALNGSLDVQVPAKENLFAAREALKRNPKATVTEVAGMNHLLQDAKTGAPSECNDIEETMSLTALKIITDWMSVNVPTRR